MTFWKCLCLVHIRVINRSQTNILGVFLSKKIKVSSGGLYGQSKNHAKVLVVLGHPKNILSCRKLVAKHESLISNNK